MNATLPDVVDSRGTLCPQPIIAIARYARSAVAGTAVVLLADDPAAAADVTAWCEMRGHRLVSAEDARYVIELVGQD